MISIGNFELSARATHIDEYLNAQQIAKLPSVYLILLLRGCLCVKNLAKSHMIRQISDYGSYPYKKIASGNLKNHIMRLQILPANNRKLFSNNNFYRLLAVEFAAAFYARGCSNWEMSFFHIYRALERMSYALPMIYAQSTQDFMKSYEHLKKFIIANDNTGEIGFLKKAVETILDANEQRMVFKYTIENSEYKAIKRCFHDSLRSRDYNSDDPVVLEFDPVQSLSFLISIRNGFFHSLSGKENIFLTELGCPDLFFQKIVDNLLNVLSYLVIKIIEN